MSSARAPGPRFGQYPLWALMAAPVAFGILLALGKRLENDREALELATPAPQALPTEWALVLVVLVLAAMTACAAHMGLLRSLLRSSESAIWYGGVLVLTAGFFRYTYGVLGASLSFYGFITWNLQSSGLKRTLFAWPMVYGALVAMVSYMTIVSGRPAAYRWRWVVVGLFLAVVATSLLLLTIQAGAWIDPTTRPRFLCCTSLVLAALAITVGCVRGDRRKAHLIDLIAALWLLPTLDQRGATISGHSIPWCDELRTAGPGYWLQALGTLLILAGAIGLLFFSEEGPKYAKSTDSPRAPKASHQTVGGRNCVAHAASSGDKGGSGKPA